MLRKVVKFIQILLSSMQDISSKQVQKDEPFAPMLRVARAILDISQAELGKNLGLTQRAVHKLESGAVSPRPRTSEAIKAFFSTMRLSFEIKDGVVKLVCPSAVFVGFEPKLALSGRLRRKFKPRLKERRLGRSRPLRSGALGR